MDGTASTFSAAEPDAISAIGRVLGQVEQWLADHKRSPARDRIETARRDEYAPVRR
jgi:hypothetical protein